MRNAVLDRLAPEADRAEVSSDAAAEARARRTTVRLALLDAVRGRHDAPWFATFEAAGAGAEAVAPLAEAAREACWWWPYQDVALISERPVALHRDEAGRLDRADGMHERHNRGSPHTSRSRDGEPARPAVRSPSGSAHRVRRHTTVCSSQSRMTAFRSCGAIGAQ
ncbi:DUF6745 domain-containing protein [Kitasatospora sp. NPDC004669]|uniref:DUF6745 domain-containing protein n=1 Tax=Kitasatospora sp. NPDC004669 TaxID=3154555 RepID=UPI0033B17CE0